MKKTKLNNVQKIIALNAIDYVKEIFENSLTQTDNKEITAIKKEILALEKAKKVITENTK